MNKLLSFRILTLLILLVAGKIAYAQDNVIDEVVWVVGDEAILKSDVEEERLNAQYEGRKIDGDPYCVIPEMLAIQKLFLHQAAIDSVTVSDSEILQRLEAQTNYAISQVGSKEKLEEYFNKTLTQIREAWRENIRDGQTVQKMQEKIAGEVKVTPAEVRQYFKSLPQDSVPYVPTQVEVQIISLQPKIPQEEIDRVKKQLREFTDRVNSGESQFSTLALLYSEDPGSARNGGELGFKGRGELVPEYANVAFNLQDPSKVSKIVESEYGFHIIQLIEKRGDRINSRHILIKPKVEEKDIEASITKLDSIADDIRNNKFTFEDGATYISQDKETRNNHGLLPNPMTGTSHFTMEELSRVSQEAAKVVDGLNVGEISKPFTMINDKGKEICAIIKLKSKINGHKATITDDYQKLKGLVVEKRKDEKLQKWIVEKQKSTYVRINEKWQKCDFQYPGWIKK